MENQQVIYRSSRKIREFERGKQELREVRELKIQLKLYYRNGFGANFFVGVIIIGRFV